MNRFHGLLCIIYAVGTDGYQSVTSITTRNWAVSISGLVDPTNVLLPVQVSVTASYTDGVLNPKDPYAGYNYENPMIGEGLAGCNFGLACTNDQPAAMTIVLNVSVSGLTSGLLYNLYEYTFDQVTGVGDEAMLKIPLHSFNANADQASQVISFTADSSTYSVQVTRLSSQIVSFRAVEASAP